MNQRFSSPKNIVFPMSCFCSFVSRERRAFYCNANSFRLLQNFICWRYICLKSNIVFPLKFDDFDTCQDIRHFHALKMCNFVPKITLSPAKSSLKSPFLYEQLFRCFVAKPDPFLKYLLNSFPEYKHSDYIDYEAYSDLCNISKNHALSRVQKVCQS